MNLKMRADGKYVLIEDYRKGWEPTPLISISPDSDNSTDSLYVFWMTGSQKQFYDLTRTNRLIIDGVDIYD